MKQIYILVFVVIISGFSSCTEVVDIDLENEIERLVIEADLEWEKGTIGNEQSIQLSLSTPFFEEDEFIPVIDAQVTVINTATNAEFEFNHEGNGVYSTSSFVPVLNNSYTLTISWKGDTFTASEVLLPVATIKRIEQTMVDGFDGEPIINLEVFADDPAEIQNFYFTKYTKANELPTLQVWDDRFQNGNEIGFIYRRVFFGLDDFEQGDEVILEYSGISEQFFNFMEILIDQAEEGGDPFATVPVQIKGNIINETNAAEKPFGFFRLGEKETKTIIIE